MPVSVGILFAFAALFLWGGGDFLIQRVTRRIGDWETLFLISVFSIIVITPFVYSNVISYLSNEKSLIVLTAASVAMFIGALITFEAYKRGKLAAVEPTLSLEIPVVAFLALVFISEALSPLEYIIVIFLLMGLFLVSLKSYHFTKSAWLEKGVLLGVISAFFLGLADFLVGFGSRLTNPLVINWFIGITLTVYTLAFLVYSGRLRKLLRDTKKSPRLILSTCALDTGAWIAYVFAVLSIPITIAVAISENFIAFAALLGILINKERFMTHQKLGLVIALASAVALALLI